MARVFVSADLTNEGCRRDARERAAVWERFLTERGSTGVFLIAHGHNKPCEEAHRQVVNGSFWIMATPPCRVFVTAQDNQSYYVSAAKGAPDPERYAGSQNCGCIHFELQSHH